jgi:pimeloyl-ACP methyl ester carboxylesterase
MGGTIAVGLAAHRPEAVERLVLAAPALPPPARGSVTSLGALRMAPFVSRRLGERILARVWGRMPPEQIHRESMALVLGDPDAVRPSVREVGIENTRAVPSLPWRIPSFAHAASDLVSTLTRRTPVHDAMAAVAAPTLVIWGTSDRLVGRPIVDDALARRPDWDRVDLDGVGHVPMLEAPERYVDAVRSWRMLAEFSPS